MMFKKICLFGSLVLALNILLILFCSFVKWKPMSLNDLGEVGRLLLLLVNSLIIIPVCYKTIL